MQGALNPSGKEKIPGIFLEALEWSEKEIMEYLSTGFTPDFHVAGGNMAKVNETTKRLRIEDLRSIANYLKQIRIKEKR